MNIKNIYKIIKKEFYFNINNYWIFLSTLIITLLNFTVIYFGEIISGDYSQTDIRSLILSIIHLQMYLIPLLSFILSYDAILTERESGVLDLILSYRISFLDIFLGKLLGNSLIFTLSFLLGFLPIAIYLNLFGVNITILLNFFINSVWLSIIFNGFALYISNSSKDRSFVILLSIIIWLFFVFMYDMFFIFLTVFLYGKLSFNILNILLFLNPAEIFRLISILCFIPTDANDLFGINAGILNSFYITLIMIIWLIVMLCSFIFNYKK